MRAIVAVDGNWGIGCENRLLFSIPEDMRHFVEFTTGKAVVMGHSTFKSLPGVPKPKPLKNRVNIVLSQNKDLQIDGVIVCDSVSRLLETVSGYESDDVIVIGGQSVYTLLLDYCTEIHVTKVKANAQADRFFPDLDKSADWRVKSVSDEKQHDGLRYAFYVYEKISKNSDNRHNKFT